MLRFSTTCRVIYGDTDKMGVAYNANYLRWFEMGRTEMFRHLGVTYREIEDRGIILPVSEAWVKYLRPAVYDDLLNITVALNPGVRAGMKFDYEIYRNDEGELLAKGYTRHACITPEGKVVRPPHFLQDLISLCQEEKHGKGNIDDGGFSD